MGAESRLIWASGVELLGTQPAGGCGGVHGTPGPLPEPRQAQAGPGLGCCSAQAQQLGGRRAESGLREEAPEASGAPRPRSPLAQGAGCGRNCAPPSRPVSGPGRFRHLCWEHHALPRVWPVWPAGPGRGPRGRGAPGPAGHKQGHQPGCGGPALGSSGCLHAPLRGRCRRQAWGSGGGAEPGGGWLRPAHMVHAGPAGGHGLPVELSSILALAPPVVGEPGLGLQQARARDVAFFVPTNPLQPPSPPPSGVQSPKQKAGPGC